MQASQDSQSSETIEDIDDNDFAFFQGNRFASILDVSPIYQIFCDLQSLFSKIHCTSSIPNYVGFVYFIVLLIQIFVPSYFIGCGDIWTDGTIATEFLRVLHVLNFDIYESIKISPYLHYHLNVNLAENNNKSNISVLSLTGAELYSNQLSKKQPIIGIFIAFFFIALNVFLIFLTKTSHAFQKINNYMGILMLIIYTIIFPLLCPHLVASIPCCFNNLVVIKNFKNNILNYSSLKSNYNSYTIGNLSEKLLIDMYSADSETNLKNANFDRIYYIIVITLVLIAFFSYILLARTIVFTRVFLEDVPLHSWLPHFPVVLVVLVSFINLISIIVFFIDGKNRFLVSLVLTFVYFIFSFYVYMSANLIRVNYSIVLSTFLLVGGLMSLVQTINIGVGSISIPNDALLILSIVLLVIVFVFFKIFNNKRLIKYSLFLDEIYENSNNSKELMEKNFKNVLQFLWKIRYMTSLWHPYFLQWELFGFAITKWPNNIWIFFIYSRLLSFFPLKNNQMMWVVIKMKKLNLSVMFNSYLMQLRQLSRTRHSMLSPQIKQQLNVIDIKIENIRSLIRCFWENVLQRNISNVREDAEKVNQKIIEMKSIYAQLLENYPNIADVIVSCLNFNDEITHDLEESKKVRKKLEILYREGKITNDRSGEIAYSIFPGLRAYLQVYDNQNTIVTDNAEKVSKLKSEFFSFGGNNNTLFKINNNNNNNNNNISSKNHNNENGMNTNLGGGESYDENEDFYIGDNSAQSNSNSNNTELCYATHNITEKSKLGRIWICCVILIFTSIVSILLFYLYISIYKRNFISRQKNALNYLQYLYKLHYDMISLTLIVNIYPFIFPNTPITMPDPKIFMKIVAPSLYPNHIPIINLTKENVNINIANIKNLFGTVIELMSTLDKSDLSCEKIDSMMFNEPVMNGMSMIALSTTMVLNAQKVVQYDEIYSFYTCAEIFELSFAIMAANSHFEKIEAESISYISMENGNQIKSLDEHMILVLTLTLLLVSFPYVLMLYKLQIQFDSLIDCFTYFPNTEIRSIINKLNKPSTNKDNSDDKSTSKGKRNKSKISMNPTALTQLDMNIVNDLNNVTEGNHLSNDNQMNGNRDIVDSQFSKLTQDKTQKLDYFKIIFTFLSSFVVISICSITTLYLAKSFVNRSKTDSVKISTIYRPFIPLKVTILLIIQFYTSRLLPNIKPYNMTAEDTLDSTLVYLARSNKIFAETFWSTNSSLDIFFSKANPFDYFEYVFEESEKKVNQPKTFFEKLATAQFLDSLDILIVSGYEYVFKYYHSFYPIEKDNEYVLSLIYWFSSFDVANRTNKFIKVIQDDIFNEIDVSNNNINTLTIVSMIWQALACIFMLFYLVERHNRIRRTLFFFHFLSPSTFIQNKQVLELLETGKNTNSILKDDSFSNADTILSKYNQGIIITDSKYLIQDFNKAFVDQFDLIDRDDIIGADLFEIVSDELKNGNNRDHIIAYCEMDLINEIETDRKRINKSQNNDDKNNNENNDENKNENNNEINNEVKNENNNDSNNGNNSSNDSGAIIIKSNHSVSFGKEIAESFSVNSLITKIFDSLSGKSSPSFSEKLFVILPNGFEHVFLVNVICITAAGVCEVGQHEKIDRIAFIFDDCTDCMLRQSMLQLELSRVTKILMKVIPTRIVSMITDAVNVMGDSCARISSAADNDGKETNNNNNNTNNNITSVAMTNDTNALLQMPATGLGNINFNFNSTNTNLNNHNNFNNNINPDDGVSFVSQGVTICQIIIDTSNFETINKIFLEFDSELDNNFNNKLTKVRTYMNTYIVIAGLFEEVSKSSQNAEEVIKFSLKILAKFRNMFNVDFLIGVNSGGPVVAGILSIDRPSFQVFGPTMETAKQLARQGVPNSVQISRSVYELVFSYGFHVTERGDIALNDGNTVQTYIVTV